MNHLDSLLALKRWKPLTRKAATRAADQQRAEVAGLESKLAESRAEIGRLNAIIKITEGLKLNREIETIVEEVGWLSLMSQQTIIKGQTHRCTIEVTFK